MRRSKRQKFLLVAFALALAALLGDRIQPGVSTSGPSQAEASVGMDIAAMLPESAVALAQEIPAQGPPSGLCLLADRMEEFARKNQLELTGVTDAFCPAPSWVGRVPQKQRRPVDPDKARVEEFIKSHRLQAVVVADRRSSAIINGRYLTLGQEMDRFKLVAVNKNSVVMVSQGARVVLRLATGPIEGSD